MVGSLAARLFLASALLLPAFLGLTGILLDQAFQRSLEAAAEARLQSHIYLLFSVAELNQEQPPRLIMPEALLEPGFERLNSGLYAFIYRPDGELVWRSRSAQLKAPPTFRALGPQLLPGELQVHTLEFSGEPHWRAHYDVLWEDEAGREHPFRFAVLRDRQAFRAELSAYRSQLWRWLGAAGLLLLLAQSAILHWGLRPMRRLADALQAMHSGGTERIAGQHPKELQQVVNNLNQVLDREQALRQRYRDSLSNLAHSLKTPLAVLHSRLRDSVADPALAEALEEQLTRMDQVVSYQLQRAVSGQQQGLHQSTPLEPAVRRLREALDKVYRDKAVACEQHIAPELRFPGDEQDLLELLGNLLENAYKYCHQRVAITAYGEQDQLLILIDDDGPGIPPEAQERVLQRGARLDSLQPGQGIGLTVAADIVGSYQGHLSIGTSSLGGARFSIRLPLDYLH